MKNEWMRFNKYLALSHYFFCCSFTHIFGRPNYFIFIGCLKKGEGLRPNPLNPLWICHWSVLFMCTASLVRAIFRRLCLVLKSVLKETLTKALPTFFFIVLFFCVLFLLLFLFIYLFYGERDSQKQVYHLYVTMYK